MSNLSADDEKCSCGVPYDLHGTACGWRNANVIVQMDDVADISWPISAEDTKKAAREGGYDVD